MSDLPDLALSVRQPWAWAIVCGLKDIENRTVFSVTKGNLNRRGRFAIHASKGMTREEYVQGYELMRSLDIACPPPGALPRGGIVGAVEIVDCVKQSDSPWFFGPRGLVLRNAMRLGVPIPCSGALGFFKWQPSGGALDAPAKWMRPQGFFNISEGE
ncbi:ASCH domain-containing protein [Bradyrhizobium tunisiense]|uniref:ASCH domain-containing protein n=1 Tax=Bradyrhizobium tunisiense TaxID=3278709 RepID=UPI0035DEC448